MIWNNWRFILTQMGIEVDGERAGYVVMFLTRMKAAPDKQAELKKILRQGLAKTVVHQGEFDDR